MFKIYFNIANINGFFFCGLEKINSYNNDSIVKPSARQIVERKGFKFVAIKTVYAKINTTRVIEIEL